jgi:hypothetical protein
MPSNCCPILREIAVMLTASSINQANSHGSFLALSLRHVGVEVHGLRGGFDARVEINSSEHADQRVDGSSPPARMTRVIVVMPRMSNSKSKGVRR